MIILLSKTLALGYWKQIFALYIRYQKITIFMGETVYQVSFGINFITVFFSKGFIQIEGSFSTIFENKTCDFCQVYPVKHDFSLLKLLERKIIEIDINSDRNVLVLTFESGKPHYQ